MPGPAETPETGFFDKLIHFQAPSQVECLDRLAEVPLLVTVPVAILGFVYLFFGWKLHKPLVTANAIIAGAIVGGVLARMSASESSNVFIFASIAGSVLLGVLAMVLMHGAVSLMGVMAGGAMGFGSWTYVSRVTDSPGLVDYPWAGALVGLVALGLLAYANFRLAVMIFTAFQGSLMLVAGATSLVLFHEELAETVRQSAESNVHFLAALVGVPAVAGFAVQYATAAKKIKKKLKASSDG